jgi:hypothetical protein
MESHLSANPEFYLVRLTAQSNGPNPKEPGGGIPEFTQQDIQQLIACIREPLVYAAINAKYCQNELAENFLLEAFRQLSRDAWHGNPAYRTVAVTTGILDGLAESAIIAYLCPVAPDGTIRGYDWAAAYISKDRKTFRYNYQSHWRSMANKLAEYESEGLSNIRRAARKEN